MTLIKGILFICVALFITNILTKDNKKYIKKIPIIGTLLSSINNLNLYIIIVSLILLIFFS